MSLTLELAIAAGAFMAVTSAFIWWQGHRFDRDFPPTKPADQQAKHG